MQVAGLTSGVEDIAAGDAHTCAPVGNAVKCWADNFDAQLGNYNVEELLIAAGCVLLGDAGGYSQR